MKRTFDLPLIVGLLVAGLTTAAMAAVPGDGVRDYPAAGSTSGIDCGFGFVDVDGDDVNDNFVDADGDGVCDLAGSGGGQKRMHGNGQGAPRNETSSCLLQQP